MHRRKSSGTQTIFETGQPPKGVSALFGYVLYCCRKVQRRTLCKVRGGFEVNGVGLSCAGYCISSNIAE